MGFGLLMFGLGLSIGGLPVYLGLGRLRGVLEGELRGLGTGEADEESELGLRGGGAGGGTVGLLMSFFLRVPDVGDIGSSGLSGMLSEGVCWACFFTEGSDFVLLKGSLEESVGTFTGGKGGGLSIGLPGGLNAALGVSPSSGG